MCLYKKYNFERHLSLVPSRNSIDYLCRIHTTEKFFPDRPPNLLLCDLFLDCPLISFPDVGKPNDILVCSKNLNIIEKYKKLIANKFKCKDLKSVNSFLGLDIKYSKENRILRFNQTKLIEKVIIGFNVTDSYIVYTPVWRKICNWNHCFDKSKVTSKPYRELVGCLMYLMMGSRPDICYMVSYFSQFQDSATNVHYNHLIRVLKYLKSTKELSLTFDRNKNDVYH